MIDEAALPIEAARIAPLLGVSIETAESYLWAIGDVIETNETGNVLVRERGEGKIIAVIPLEIFWGEE